MGGYAGYSKAVQRQNDQEKVTAFTWDGLIRLFQLKLT